MTITINGRTPEEIKKGLECCKYGRWTVIADMGYSKSRHKLLLWKTAAPLWVRVQSIRTIFPQEFLI